MVHPVLENNIMCQNLINHFNGLQGRLLFIFVETDGLRGYVMSNSPLTIQESIV